MALFSKRITTTRGRLLAVIALLAVVAYAPSAFGAKQTPLGLARSALNLAKGADKKATKALKPVGSQRIQDGTVGAVDLADGTIATADISAGGVTSSNIFDGTIVAADIATGAVGTAQLADGAVTTEKIDSLAVDGDRLAGDAVSSAKIEDGQVRLQDLASGKGTAVVDPNSLLPGECAEQTFIAPTLVNGDVVVINFQTAPDSALEVTPMVATGPDLRLRICNRASGTVDAAAFAVSYFSLR
jgi:hypothetical protein